MQSVRERVRAIGTMLQDDVPHRVLISIQCIVRELLEEEELIRMERDSLKRKLLRLTGKDL